MMKYKVWIHIEELDEEEGHYMDLEEHTQSIGPEFDTPEEAVTLKERLIDLVTNDGEVVWVPPEKEFIPQECPECGVMSTPEKGFVGVMGTFYCGKCAVTEILKESASQKPIDDYCPECGLCLMPGPNGCTICSKTGCTYWRK